MKRERVQLLNCRLDNITFQELLTEFNEGMLVTANVDHLITLQEDREFYDIYREADYAVADGQIIVSVLQHLLGTPVQEKISGSDFFPAYCHHHRENPDVRVFLLGGRTGAAEQARENINRREGREVVVGACSPSMGFVNNPEESAAVIRQINEVEATVVGVGLGAPLQEKWIRHNRASLPGVRCFMGIGITIEFQAGYQRRCPPWVSRAGLEWLHRLTREPHRLWRRYLVRDLPFFFLVLQQRRGKYRNPFADDAGVDGPA